MSWIQTGRGERCLLGALSHLSLGWHPQAARPTACPEAPTEGGKNLLSFSLCRQGLPPLAMRRQPGTQLGGCLLQCWALPCLLELTVTGEEAEAPVVPLLSPAKPHGPAAAASSISCKGSRVGTSFASRAGSHTGAMGRAAAVPQQMLPLSRLLRDAGAGSSRAVGGKLLWAMVPSRAMAGATSQLEGRGGVAGWQGVKAATCWSAPVEVRPMPQGRLRLPRLSRGFPLRLLGQGFPVLLDGSP